MAASSSAFFLQSVSWCMRSRPVVTGEVWNRLKELNICKKVRGKTSGVTSKRRQNGVQNFH